MSIGVPIKLLHEAEGHIVTIELKTGEVYSGNLVEAEDNMNCQMKGVQLTHCDGRTQRLEQCFLRGSKIRFVVVPDMLKNAPMFRRVGEKTGRGLGAMGTGGGAGGGGASGARPGRGSGMVR